MVKVSKHFELNIGYRAFQRKPNAENAKWAFVDLYEAERKIPDDAMKVVYEILKKQVCDYQEEYPPAQGYDLWKWNNLFNDIEGIAEEKIVTQEEIFKCYAKEWGIEDSQSGIPAWELLRDKYKRKFRGKK